VGETHGGGERGVEVRGEAGAALAAVAAAAAADEQQEQQDETQVAEDAAAVGSPSWEGLRAVSPARTVGEEVQAPPLPPLQPPVAPQPGALAQRPAAPTPPPHPLPY